MQVLKTQLTDGSVLPVLVRKNPLAPILVPFIYNIVQLKGKAENTKRNIFTSLKYFYSFIETECMLDVDELLITTRFDLLIEKLDEFSYWVVVQETTGRSVNNPATKDAHLRNLKDFLCWAANRYIKSDSRLQRIQGKIKGSFQASVAFTASRRFTYKSLIDREAHLVEEFSHPAHPFNPYRQSNRFRNWLIIQLLTKLGLRVGELLKVRCKDIYKYDNGNFYLQVIEDEGSVETRKSRPSLKNQFSQRTISISEELYNSCVHYITNLRRPMHGGKPAKIKTGFLLLSERGKPISSNNVNEIVKRIEQAIKEKHPDFSTHLSPHIFRHTFAETFLRYLIETLCFDMERAKDHLRAICGWSINSPMPNFYGARYIAEKANSENLKRISSPNQ